MAATIDSMDPIDRLVALSGFEPSGPVARATAWLHLAIGADYLASAWPLTHPTLRLCLVQEAMLRLGMEPDDDFAARLARKTPEDPGWPVIARQISNALDDRYPGIEVTHWLPSSRPRIVAPGLEAVVFIHTGGEPREITEPELVRCFWLLTAHTDAGFLVAAMDTQGREPQSLPIPGWPPTW